MSKCNLSSLQALELLLAGNERFAQGLRSVETFLTQSKLKELAEKGQSPFAVVLTCSDSRVPAEIVFDRGLGDLFVIRVAGNVIAPSLVASIEFAALNFGTPLCVVMGHSYCGAVRTTLENELRPQPAPTENLESLVKRIRPAVRHTLSRLGKQSTHEELMHHATLANVRHSVRAITRKSPTIKQLVDERKFLVTGALYDLHTGRVDFELPRELSTGERREEEKEAI